MQLAQTTDVDVPSPMRTWPAQFKALLGSRHYGRVVNTAHAWNASSISSKTAMALMPWRLNHSTSGDMAGGALGGFGALGTLGGEDSVDVCSDIEAVGGWSHRNLSSRMAMPDRAHA